MPFPVLPITSDETLRRCACLPPERGDIFICSYPKSGTTWTQNIVSTLAAEEAGAPPFKHVSEVSPFLEIDPHWETDGQFSSKFQTAWGKLNRRIWNTHLPWEMMPKGDDATRFIYLERDGRDVCTSFFHHLSNQTGDAGGFEGPFEDFFQDWIDGKLPYGCHSEHLLSWAAARKDPRVLLLRYEDLLTDLPTQVENINCHLGLGLSSQTLASLIPSFEFHEMQQSLDRFQPISVKWKSESFKFLRKGTAGDHVNIFTQDLLEKYERHINDKRAE